ncbi:hypothetical protein E3N88_08923 [Mikania micrantha]|uniref:Uncharacterized protein n=1 Tax=Mikania micrantha TaxID=192012 RepID=A0A5N6PIK6_9ASTR|nr:hypothetical protein E3N88_08923 [Mikania micrantha]
MYPLYPNNYFNLGDLNDYSPSLLFSNPVEDFVIQSPQSSQNAGKESQANKWDAAEDIALVSACGMSLKDVENDTHKIYEQESGCKFNDSVVFYEVMCKHQKWDLQLKYDTTRSRLECEVGNEESGGRRKRSRTNEEGDYCVNSNPEVSTTGGSTIKRPTGRDSAKKKGKGKAYNELAEELHAMRVTRDSEIELMRKRIKLEQLRDENSSNGSDSSNLNEYDESEAQFFEQNQQLDDIMKVYRCYAGVSIWDFSYAHDEYLRMSETVTRDSLTRLHRLHAQAMEKLSNRLGRTIYRHDKATIILEFVASYDLWIWHAFFGTRGSCNDINVLHRSPIFDDVLSGRAPNVSYVVNGREYNMAYYLTNGIYPPWETFVKSITSPQLRKDKLFAQHQEANRKDVERAFGVLQACFAFL